MTWVRLGRDEAPRFAAFGVVTPAGVGARALLDAGTAGTDVAIDLPALLGEPPLRFRRLDRYGELAYAAARLALGGSEPCAATAPAGPEAADPCRGVMLGSSLACWASNVRHHRERRAPAREEAGPAIFVRTVANSVNGDLSIALRFGGPGLLFAGGWTAGADAIACAASALAERRARSILAGGVEAPGPELRALHAPDGPRPGARGFTGLLAEGAAIAVLEEAAGPGPIAGEAPLRLHAYARGYDPEGDRSVATLLDVPAPLPLGVVVFANTMPAARLERARAEAAPVTVLHLPDRAGELGAAGAPAAVAMVDAMRMREGALVVARDPAGGWVALALGR